MPSPQPSLGPVKRVRVRRNSRRVAPGSTSPSRSSTRSPLTAKTTAAEDGAGEAAAAAIALARRGERDARRGAFVRACGPEPDSHLGGAPQLAYLLLLLYSTATATSLARSQLRGRGRCRREIPSGRRRPTLTRRAGVSRAARSPSATRVTRRGCAKATAKSPCRRREGPAGAWRGVNG